MSSPLSPALMSYVSSFPQEESKEPAWGSSREGRRVGKITESFWGPWCHALHHTHPAHGTVVLHTPPEWKGAFSHCFSNIDKSEWKSAEQSLCTLLAGVSAALPSRLGCLFYKSSEWSLLTAKNKFLITFTWINLATRCGIHPLSVQQLQLRVMKERARGAHDLGERRL